ncbi:hypothetical protein J1614_011177 [Plenodomus biglobosus]|nr:hypothetical protein J1614_011177 [Plenodomus biglobosus]
MGRQVRKRAFSNAFQPTLGYVSGAYRRAFRKNSPPSLALPVASSDQDLYAPPTGLGSRMEFQTSPSKYNAQAIGLFEVSPQFPPFDSNYDYGVDSKMSAGSNMHGSQSDIMTGGVVSQPIDFNTDYSDAPQSSNTGYWHNSSTTQDGLQDHRAYDLIPSDSSTQPDSSSPGGPVLGACLEPTFAIYEDPESFNETILTVSDQPSDTYVSTPSALNFQDLSLVDVPGWSQSDSLPDYWPIPDRTLYYTLPSTVFKGYFPDLMSTDIILSFAKGRQHLKIAKHTICSASTYFAKLLDVAYPPSDTQVLRLRDDFPPVIPAMHSFLTTGTYPFDSSMLTSYPNITLPDLHIHAYITGLKYALPALHTHALTQYTTFAQDILALGISWPSNITSDIHTTRGNIMLPPLLYSFLLLWRNTHSRHDALRCAVLERLVKPHLNAWLKVAFFVRLMREDARFGGDVVASLEEDGFVVTVGFLKEGWGDGAGSRWGVRFGDRL